jgi:hypothetical protein
MALFLPPLLCLACGFVFVSLGWSLQSPRISDLLLRATFSFGFGVGIFSVIFFLARVSGITNVLALDLTVLAFLLAGFFFLRTRAKAVTTPPAREKFEGPIWLHRVLTATFVVALCAAVYSTVLRTLTHPHGDGWDAFAIWNLHARFMFRGGTHWRDGFTPLIPWSHPDYPLLLPAAVAHFWTFLGYDAPALPAGIGCAFTFATVALLFSSLSILRGAILAMLGGLTLLATPSFIALGTWQYADVPFSFFILATIVLLRLYDARHSPGFLALAGLAAGFAAWTKNEGILFLATVVLARSLIVRQNRSLQRESRPIADIVFLLLSILPVLLVVAYFKHFVAPAGDLFSNPATMLHKLLDPLRYWIILSWYAREFLRFGHWLFVPAPLLLLAYYCFTRRETQSDHDSSDRASILALSLTLAGYFAIYLITPYDLYWHLRFSLSRLFLQLWPSAIFLFFLAVPCGVGGPRSPSLTLPSSL